MEPTRTALLIGVEETPSAGEWFSCLEETVKADLRELSAALRGAGYAVEVLRNPTRNEITARLAGAAREAAAGGTFLVYFTGHGIRVGGVDYLLPSNALAPAKDDASGWDQPHILESLLSADIGRYLAGCAAGTVLWTIDACRNSGDETAFGGRITQGPTGSGFAVLTSCAPGQRSGYTEKGSFFTLALAEAFDPLTEATTVAEVYETTRRLTRQLARRDGSAAQDAQIRYGDDFEQRTRDTVVTRGRRLLETWREAVDESPLWDRVADSAAVPHLRECLLDLVTETARQLHRAQGRLPDPWADDDLPARLIRDRLPQLLPADSELSALEAASLIAAVFLHEAAWAGRLSQAAELSPLTPGHLEGADDRRIHYEQIMGRHPEISDKLSALSERAERQADGAQSVGLWLVHRWIAERFSTDEQAVPEVLVKPFAAAVLGAEASGRGRVGEFVKALQLIASALSHAFSADQAEQQASRLPGRHVLSGRPCLLRIRPLAALLRFAGLLALDARTMSDVLAEHVEVSDPVLPREVTAVLRDALWDAETDSGTAGNLHLDAVCPHPAIHAALKTVVEDADDLGYTLRETAQRLPSSEAELLRGLPSRVTDQRLRPDESGGVRAYDLPLLQFSLAQTEVRRLLMGESLYDGRPILAVRELYQNALDACRHREMRLRYLRSREESPAPWEGGIVIETGEDERGRYVECRDNGVGMTVDQLKGTFTRAGRRFEQSREFQREQAAWLRHDPSLKLYPNSRFGIGVFSYFMLADEMTIVTRPVGRDGAPAPRALRVEIPASGSLFRVQEEPGQGAGTMPGGGTRVRLYLRADTGFSEASCRRFLRELVRFTEFRLELRGGAGESETWEPRILHSGSEDGLPVEAVAGTLWWVAGPGAILCDGIATDKLPFGYVLNLTGAHAGRLSVNRNRLEAYDTVWALQQCRLGALALRDWHGLDLSWLARMEERDLFVARTLWEELHGKGIQVRTPGDGTRSLDEIGWFALDANEKTDSDRQNHTDPWRQASLKQIKESISIAYPANLEGHPIPAPGMAGLAEGMSNDWRRAISLAHEQRATVAEILRRSRSLRITHPSLAAPCAREGDLDWVPDEIDTAITKNLLENIHKIGPDNHMSTSDIFLQMVRLSTVSGWPLGKIAAAHTRYTPLSGILRTEVPEHHESHVCTRDDLFTVCDADAYRPRLRMTPWSFIELARYLGVDVEEARERIVRFSWMGIPEYEEDLLRSWAGLPEDLLRTFRSHVGFDHGGTLRLHWRSTIEFSAKTGRSLQEAEDALASAAKSLNVSFTRRMLPDRGRTLIQLKGDNSSESSMKFMNFIGRTGVLSGLDPSLRELASHFLFYGEERTGLLIDVMSAIKDLPIAKSDVLGASRLARAWPGLPTISRYVFSGHEPSPRGADQPGPPEPGVLFTASALLHEDLSFSWRTAEREALRLDLTPAFHPSPLPAELNGHRPTRLELMALTDWVADAPLLSNRTPRWVPLSPGRLIRFARTKDIGPQEAYKALLPLRAIGALIPELSKEALAGLPSAVPSVHDAEVFNEERRLVAADRPLTPLDLVSTAGALGESTARTWRRIVPYIPFEPAPPLIAAVPDVLPLWQDLAILSEGLDGLLPAIGGRITPERLAFAADGVGESAAWVRERLTRYAAMFELELPSAEEIQEQG